MMSGGHATALARATDEELVCACLDGSEDAWAALINRYKNLIYAVPLRGGASAEDAVDIFHGVCRHLFAELPQLRRADCLRGWLLTAAAQKLFELRNQQTPNDAGQSVAGEPAILPPSVLQQIDCDQRVRDAVEQLPDRCRRLVQQLFHEHPPRPYHAVAPQLGLATGSSGFIRGRCLIQLARSLRVVWSDHHAAAARSKDLMSNL